MEEEFLEIEHIARTVDGGNVSVSLGDKHFIENRLFFAEEDIFEIFTLPLLERATLPALLKSLSPWCCPNPWLINILAPKVPWANR